jgi:PadR family transcriptional regulator PadR
MRLATIKLLQTRWESPETGKPPRHMYKLTAAGLKVARDEVRSNHNHQRVVRPAFNGAES